MTDAGRPLPAGTYFHEDVAVGDHWQTGGLKVTEAHVVNFAGLTGDFFDLHMDDAAAEALGFPERVAHGLLILSLVDGLKNRADVRLAAVASLGWDWSFKAPVFIGDRIQANLRIAETRPTKKPDRGIVTLAFEVTKPDGTVVQNGTNAMMMRRGGGG